MSYERSEKTVVLIMNMIHKIFSYIGWHMIGSFVASGEIFIKSACIAVCLDSFQGIVC